MTDKVLLVDDEPNILKGFQRHLRKQFNLHVAVGGAAALEAVRDQGPFAVVVSDMQMPEISGVELLNKLSSIAPQTVRVMLTGNADQKTAADAVNEGQIFRFLNKPCPPDKLAQVLDAGLEQYRLVTAEAELLNKTLSGSVLMLTQVLSIAMPEAFGLTQEAKKWARTIAEQIGIGPLWQVEMAATLMRVGCVSLPKETLDAYLSGKELTRVDVDLLAECPKMGHELIASIPRLQEVADFILHQNDPPSDPTPIASRILRVIGDYQRFYRADPGTAIRRLDDPELYDQSIVEALRETLSDNSDCADVMISELRNGMVLASSVLDGSGRLLVADGLEIHEAIIQKLEMFQKLKTGVKEPIKVRVASEATDDATAVAAEVAEHLLQEN